MAFGDYTTIETPAQVSQADVRDWVGNRGPGALITNLVTDVGSYTEHERRGLRGYSSFMHRDELAGHNLCNIIQGHLLDQVRPQYLQPVYEDGTLVWAPNKDKYNVKDQDLPKCSTSKARSEERGRPTTAKDASKEESRDSSQSRRALVKNSPSVPAKDVSMDEPQETSHPDRILAKCALPDPLEEETPLGKKTVRLG
ncbi:MAG: hypothetical protein JOS17DRAFT_773128 [Linnemannia elongata]|nr:MAG: hypothetical protein JOS17DRAFT_773128 [Linnemannia elongata]